MTFSFKSSRRASVLALAATGLLAAMGAQAQDAASADARIAPGAVRGMPCPNPVNINFIKSSGPAAPDISKFPAEYQTGGLHGGLRGSTFNQTESNKWFGHTFVIPQKKEQCCQYRDARLVVTYKSLGGGLNDGSRVYWGASGANVINSSTMSAQGHIWPQGGTPAPVGTMVTHAFVIPANVVAQGNFSLWAQDDTAVTSVRLTVSGCCVDPTEPAR